MSLLAHIGAVPVEEMLGLAPAATALVIAAGVKLRCRFVVRPTIETTDSHREESR